MFDLVLNSAQVLRPTASGWKLEQLHIGIQNQKIKTFSTTKLQGEQTLDLTGLIILPGLIDSQVHFREPGLTHKEDLESGTRAAALGGITTVFEMPNTNPSTSTEEAFFDKVNRAKNRVWTDIAFFIGAAPENTNQLARLELLLGCSGVKLFMGSSTGSLLVESDENIEKVLINGKRRLTVHAEDEFILRERKQIAIDSKKAISHHDWRNVDSALSATTRLIQLAEKIKRQVHVLHVTSAEEMSFLAQHKAIASVEVLPQHLTLHAPDCYERFGTWAQQNPPIRERRHQEALWWAINNSIVDVLGSDHAPHTREEKAKEYPSSPSGLPGVQTTVPLMLNHVAEGRLSLERFTELMTTGPRRVFGLKNKGLMAVGEDADFTVVDLKARRTIEESWLASRAGWSPFVGLKVKGWPMATIVRGQVVMQEDQLLKTPIGEMCQFDV